MKRFKLTPRRQTNGITILDTMADPQLFARWFKDEDTWAAWTVFLCALFALPMTRDQLKLYRKCTGRTNQPTDPAEEAWLVIGRRGGKSFIMALTAVFLACFKNYRSYLAPGERATVMIVAADRKQGRIVIRYIRALLKETPMLALLIEAETKESFDLSNHTTIEVHTASFRSTRGYTLCAVIADEIAFWPTDEVSAEPDKEIINALRPGLATIPGAVLLCASSPYARRGELWNAHRRHFGHDHDPILIWQASTRTMNPTVSQTFIDREIEKDPASAEAEYGAQFRTDIEAFISRDAVEACVSTGVRERRPKSSKKYYSFTDPAGGSGQDSFTLAIGHYETVSKTVVVDAIREIKPRFDTDEVVKEFAALLKQYDCLTVMGDRYAGDWPRNRFAAHGITYQTAEKSKTMLYVDALPLLNSQRIQLLDHPRLISQLCGLERKTTRGTGREIVDHPPGIGQHDDLSNAVAGLAAYLSVSKSRYDISFGDADDDDGETYLANMQHLAPNLAALWRK